MASLDQFCVLPCHVDACAKQLLEIISMCNHSDVSHHHVNFVLLRSLFEWHLRTAQYASSLSQVMQVFHILRMGCVLAKGWDQLQTHAWVCCLILKTYSDSLWIYVDNNSWKYSSLYFHYLDGFSCWTQVFIKSSDCPTQSITVSSPCFRAHGHQTSVQASVSVKFLCWEANMTSQLRR